MKRLSPQSSERETFVKDGQQKIKMDFFGIFDYRASTVKFGVASNLRPTSEDNSATLSPENIYYSFQSEHYANSKLTSDEQLLSGFISPFLNHISFHVAAKAWLGMLMLVFAIFSFSSDIYGQKRK
jgi:hypothetical protein